MRRSTGFWAFISVFFVAALGVGTTAIAADNAEKTIENEVAYWKTPKPRLNLDQHSAMIRSAAVDPSGAYFVTGSHDKTAKVWRLPKEDGETVRLLRTLRPPIGDGDIGKINAVAISPDASLVAVGGWMGAYTDASPETRNQEAIYLFDRNTGQLKLRIDGVPSRVYDLAFSPDGKAIAAAMRHGSGVGLWSTSDGALIGQDDNYDADCTALDFLSSDSETAASNAGQGSAGGSGSLLVASSDGKARLYRPAALKERKLVASWGVDLPDNKEPSSVAFAPGGAFFAVGYLNSPTVSVHKADSGTEHINLPADGIENGDLASVTWSKDGRHVFAGGSWYNEETGLSGIRRWSLEAVSDYKNIYVSNDRVVSLAPNNEGGFVFASMQPAFGAVASSGDVVFSKGPSAREMRSSQEAWNHINNDSSKVFVSGNPYTEEVSIQFDLKYRLLQRKQSAEQSLRAPVVESELLKIDGWNDDIPSLGGSDLELIAGEFSNALAIAADNSKFLIGTNYRARLYDKQGKQIWDPLATPDEVWRVNITSDGRLAVIAYGDGTVRWHRMSDGQELLALFVHKDTKRWVMWTPEGYYDASPGGDSLIGWHINQSENQEALFYNVSRYADLFYRPDIVAEAISGNLSNKPDSAPAAEEFKANMPPVIRILRIEERSEGAPLLRYEIESPSGDPVEEINILIDGKLKETKQLDNDTRASGAGVLELICSEEDREIVLATKGSNGSFSETEAAEIVEFCTAPKHKKKRRLFALIIGVSNYQNENVKDLKYADDDANAVAELLRVQKRGKFYDDVEVEVLTDQLASRANILNALQWLTNEPTDNDVSLVYIAGHGENLKRSDQKPGEIPRGPYFFLSHDADRNQLASSAVGIGALENYARYARGRKLFFLDTCYAGNVDTNGLLNDLAADELGTIVYASSTSTQLSKEGIGAEHGVFTSVFLDALSGAADSQRRPDGLIDRLELASFLQSEVEYITEGVQTPVHHASKALPKTNIASVVNNFRRLIVED